MTSLSLSKELFEAGLEMETEHYWGYISAHQPPNDFEIDNGEEKYPAYSTDELLEVLPKGLEILYDPAGFVVWFTPNLAREFHTSDYKSLSEALGKMALYLLRNGYHYNQSKGVMEK